MYEGMAAFRLGPLSSLGQLAGAVSQCNPTRFIRIPDFGHAIRGESARPVFGRPQGDRPRTRK